MTSPSASTRIIGRAAAAALAALALASSAALAASGSGGVGIGGGTGQTGQTGQTGESADGVFPIRGKHTYGDGLGAGRGHDGQDLMAKCGKPVVAVWPGRVQMIDYHGAAGNYVVVDGKGALQDTVYMHLRERASVRKGQRVAAGDLLGRVGDTGNASACHLHFEVWSNPGYYQGGHPLDPEPFLRGWDPKRRG